MQKKNLVLKQQFGNLTINSSPSEENGKIVYSCKCSCGKTVTVSEDDLKSGNKSSCGHDMTKFVNYPLNLTYFINVEGHKKDMNDKYQEEEIQELIEYLKTHPILPEEPENPEIPEEDIT